MKNDKQNIKDYVNYQKGCNIAKEITTLMKDDRHHELHDYKELKEWFETNQNAIDSTNILTSTDICKNFQRKERQYETERLLSSINSKKSKVRTLSLARLVSTSIVAAVFAISFILLYPSMNNNRINEENSSNTISNDDVKTKSSKPTLVLSNGESIDLMTVNKNNVHIVESTPISDTPESHIIETVEYNTIVIPKQFTYNLILTDGTEVFLNANSELRYPLNFSGDNREVFLKGEGYFNVKKGEKPFIVSTQNIQVKVYGTKFNIFTTDNDDVEATLVKGSIGVKRNKDDKDSEVILKPGQAVHYYDNTINVKEIDSDEYLAWRENKFCYKNRSIKRVLYDISQWYGIKINYNPDLSDKIFTLVISRDEELSYVLDFISNITGLKFEKIGKEEYKIIN